MYVITVLKNTRDIPEISSEDNTRLTLNISKFYIKNLMPMNIKVGDSN